MTSDPPAGPEPAGAIAVLGTGIMGSAMGCNLIAAGLHTTVWDQSREATAPLAAEGAGLPMLDALSRQWHTAVEADYGRDDVSAARLALGGPARMEG
jgi:3-hydroxyacyl-CoA dehydrogenase